MLFKHLRPNRLSAGGRSHLHAGLRFLSTRRDQLEQEGLVRRKVEAPKNVDVYVERQTKNHEKKKAPRTKNRIAKEDLDIELIYLKTAESRMHQLQQIPIGSFTEQDWIDAQNLMEYFCQIVPGKNQNHLALPLNALTQTIPWSFEVLNRLVQEHVAQPNQKVSIQIIENEWLNATVLNWRQIYARSRRNVGNHAVEIMSPQEILEQVEGIAVQCTGLEPSDRIYTTIMDAALRQCIKNSRTDRFQRQRESNQKELKPKQNVEETVVFIDSLLQRLQSANRKQDAFAYKTTINAWECVGNGSRALEILKTMISLYEKGHSSLEPKRDYFQSVLRAFARSRNKSAETVLQCQEVIRLMEDFHKREGLDTSPDTNAFNSVLTCISYNSNGDRVAEAEHFFDQEIPSPFRDIHTYNIMLELYSKERLEQKAVSFLKQMVEEYERNGDKRTAPNIKSFNIVLSCLTRTGNHGAVEKHFQLMEALHANNVLPGVAPDQVTYSILLDNWVKQVGKVPGACDRADAIVHTMERLAKVGNTSVRPNLITYTTLMTAHANAGEFVKAEEVLNRMIDEYLQSRDVNIRPDRAAFNTLLLSLSRSDEKYAPQKILEIIQRMDSLHATETLGRGHDIRPDVRSYNHLLFAIERSGLRDAGEQCERLILQTMLPNPRLAPNVKSYMPLIQAYAKAGKPEHAERMLEHVCHEYLKQDSGKSKNRIKPSVHLFSAVMKAWSKCGTAEAPERASAIMQKMKKLFATGDLAGSVDVVVYNILLDAFANSDRDDAGERAEAILQEMEGTPGVTPDTTSMNTLMKVWALRGDGKRCENVFNRLRESADIQPSVETLCTLLTAISRSDFTNDEERAEIVLIKLNELQESMGITANVACYNVALNCLSKSKTEQSCLVAEDLLHEMERLGSQHKDCVRPDVVSYGCVIDAFANVGDADNAERILDRLIYTYALKKDPRLRPTTHCFNIVLKAFKKSGSPPGRAEALIQRARRLRKAAGISVGPDTASYNLLMDIHANARTKKAESLKRILSILQNMIQSNDTSCMPTTQSFNIVLKALAQRGLCVEAERLFESMYAKIPGGLPSLPDAISFNCLVTCFLRQSNLEAAMRLFRRMNAAYQKGDKNARPNLTTFRILLDGCGEATEYRQEILRHLHELYPNHATDQSDENEKL